MSDGKVDRGPGQPPIGPTVKFACPPELLAELDDEARKLRVSRSDVIRRKLSA